MYIYVNYCMLLLRVLSFPPILTLSADFRPHCRPKKNLRTPTQTAIQIADGTIQIPRALQRQGHQHLVSGRCCFWWWFSSWEGSQKKLTKIGLPRHKCCDWMQHPDNNVKHNGRVLDERGNMPLGFWNMMQIALISFKKLSMPMESTQSLAFDRNDGGFPLLCWISYQIAKVDRQRGYKHLDPIFGTSPSRFEPQISFWTTSAKSLWARSWQFVQPFFWLAMIRL